MSSTTQKVTVQQILNETGIFDTISSRIKETCDIVQRKMMKHQSLKPEHALQRMAPYTHVIHIEWLYYTDI